MRYIVKGEARFYEALKDKYGLIIDLYDRDNYEDMKNYYWSDNRFTKEKASSFEL